jgi:hypothetical protein
VFKRKVLRLCMVILFIAGLFSMGMDLVQATSSNQKAEVTTESEVDEKLQEETKKFGLDIKDLSLTNLKAKIYDTLNK